MRSITYGAALGPRCALRLRMERVSSSSQKTHKHTQAVPKLASAGSCHSGDTNGDRAQTRARVAIRQVATRGPHKGVHHRETTKRRNKRANVVITRSGGAVTLYSCHPIILNARALTWGVPVPRGQERPVDANSYSQRPSGNAHARHKPAIYSCSNDS